MALIRRISRLITADMHAVLDQLEEPEAVLRQAIRDMDDQLADLNRQIQRSEAALAANDRRAAGLDKSLRELDAKLDLCFAENNDALARKLVKRKLETRRLLEAIESTREDLATEVSSLSACSARQRDELEGMRQKAAVFLNAERNAAGTRQSGEVSIDESEIDIALIAERQARRPA
jgi:phage shock protein A